MITAAEPMENQLLAALPAAELQRWTPQLELVDLPLGEVLYESGTTLSHVYFPLTAIVSLLYVMENGASAEIAVVGNEGIVARDQQPAQCLSGERKYAPQLAVSYEMELPRCQLGQALALAVDSVDGEWSGSDTAVRARHGWQLSAPLRAA